MLRHCCWEKERRSLSVLWQTADRSRQQLLSFVCRAGVKADIKPRDDWPLCRDAADWQHGSMLPWTDEASYALWHHIHNLLRVRGTCSWICPACWQILECNCSRAGFPVCPRTTKLFGKQHKDHLTQWAYCCCDKNEDKFELFFCNVWCLHFVWCLPPISALQCAYASPVPCVFFLPVVLETFFSFLCQWSEEYELKNAGVKLCFCSNMINTRKVIGSHDLFFQWCYFNCPSFFQN